MSSNKDKIRDWFFALPEEQQNQIDSLIEDIREKEGLIEIHEQSLREMIRKLARILEPLIKDPSQTSMIIKAIANGRISDETIEKVLPEDKKRKHKPYELFSKREINGVDFSRPVTVASDGSESHEPESKQEPELYEGDPEPIPSVQEVNEQATEIALTLADQYAADAKERDLRLNEALKLADDKNKRIEQLLLENGELELKIIDLQTAADQAKEVDRKEELQIEVDNMKLTIHELQEALRAKVKTSGFTQASQLPKQVWLAAINAINFYRELNKASRFAIEHNDPWKKIVFDVAEDGQLKAAKLEGQ